MSARRWLNDVLNQKMQQTSKDELEKYKKAETTVVGAVKRPELLEASTKDMINNETMEKETALRDIKNSS